MNSLEIEIFGQLSIKRESRIDLKINSPKTALEAARELGLNPESIGLVTINGKQSNLDDVVRDKDRICFFPYMSGG
jgi:molybdopterin converting factor small subunit